MSKKSPTNKEAFEASLRRNLEAELDPDATICPKCGRRLVTRCRGGWGAGVCQPCYQRAQIAAYEAATLELALRREIGAARKRRRDVLQRQKAEESGGR